MKLLFLLLRFQRYVSASISFDRFETDHASTAIHCLTNWTFTRLFIIVCSVKAATTIKATTSRFALLVFSLRLTNC